MTKAEEKRKLAAGAVWIAQTGDWSYDAIAVGKTEAEARRLCVEKARKVNGLDHSFDYINSGVSVWLLAPGEAAV